MNTTYTTLGISARIWISTAIFSSLALSIFMSTSAPDFNLMLPVILLLLTLVFSLPALIFLLIALEIVRSFWNSLKMRFINLVIALFLISVLYGLVLAGTEMLSFFVRRLSDQNFFKMFIIYSGVLFASGMIALFLHVRPAFNFFCDNYAENDSRKFIYQTLFNHTSKTNNNMESQYDAPTASTQPSNRILIKGLITGGLILLMLIPTVFINNLISEREARQKEVVKEVSSKWAGAQTLSGPFLVVPYTDTSINSDGKTIIEKIKLILLANDLTVKGKIIPEERPRSIYKVLLYKTAINLDGSFKIGVPPDINVAAIDFSNAKLCFTLSDFKGIEEEIYVNFNGQKLLMSPGLPVNDFGNVGLSVPINITPGMLAVNMPFAMQVKIKGSEELHFTPMAATSKYTLSSDWPDASFNGEVLPGERQVSDSGFAATWNFNQANIPFSKVMKTNSVHERSASFGVSLVQTTDQYAKTMRSVKYAILFIGLTFAFFFIIELMQKKPFHPVQYVLVGLALVIFYTLLLSISEYILFNYAYFIASLAIVLLISFYAKAHFNSWKTGAIFFVLLSCLYGFIFILISLEDTALLVGSIGLFIVLALVMFASRRINWYGSTQPEIIPS